MKFVHMCKKGVSSSAILYKSNPPCLLKITTKPRQHKVNFRNTRGKVQVRGLAIGNLMGKVKVELIESPSNYRVTLISAET